MTERQAGSPSSGTVRLRRTGQLAMGARLAVTGGRESVLRTVLTALGVGLGVAMLLFASAIPAMKHHRDDRIHALVDTMHADSDMAASSRSVLLAEASTRYHDAEVRGRLVRPEGPDAPLPPGLARYPKPGEMIVSPALGELLGSSEGRLLRERLNLPVAGEIGQDGLVGPGDLTFWAGSDSLTTEPRPSEAASADGVGAAGREPRAMRLDSFGDQYPPRDLEPVLLLLSVVGIVVLLTPVVVFVGAAARFGGESRDRRLAALRLAGADRSMTARIAAGEALTGALLGLAAGWLLFLGGRRLGELVSVNGVSVFARDIEPQPLLAAGVMVVVPVLAVGVTLAAMRRIAVEPLSVVRRSGGARRRLWWRLLLPAAGALLLAGGSGSAGPGGGAVLGIALVTDAETLAPLVAGLVLVLVGIAVLLPALLDLVTGRLGAGPPSWQLAVRRLRLSGGPAARATSGVVVAVAGGIALQSLFGGVASHYTHQQDRYTFDAAPPADGPPAAYLTLGGSGGRAAEYGTRLRGAPGSSAVLAYSRFYVSAGGAGRFVPVDVGDCDALRAMAVLPACTDGDVFVVGDTRTGMSDPDFLRPGARLTASGAAGTDPAAAAGWQLPAVPGTGDARPGSAEGRYAPVLLATPGAVPADVLRRSDAVLNLTLDRRTPDAREHLRNAVALVLPGAVPVFTDEREDRSQRAFLSVARVLTAAVTVTLVLIAVSMLVGLLEQLRERRRVLAALAAFGTRRRTLGASVLWQSALPMALGLLLAVAVGTGLGRVLLRLAGLPVRTEWTGVLTMTATGAAAVLGVTVLTLPLLVRLVRPDGLRFE